MGSVSFKDKSYDVDADGFLVEFEYWDEDFAEGMAPRIKIAGGLTKKHWAVIGYIRDSFKETGFCPLIYKTCRMNGLRLKDFKTLFPTGYLRGACLLAGITYREGFIGHAWLAALAIDHRSYVADKAYQTDVRGFLIDPYAWDRQFAIFKAFEMKMPHELSDRHWQIIDYLRSRYLRDFTVPTIYETCEANNLEIEELEQLFPDGYHRGAVKIAGLRVR